MKNLLLLLITITLLLFNASCHKERTYKIGISQCSSDDWRDKMNQEVKLEAMLHDNVEVEIRSADSDSKKQIDDLQYFVDNDFDVIVVSPNEAETLTPVIREIYKKGIPVVIFDRNINDTTYTQRIGVDNIGMGQSAARYAHNLIPKGLKILEVYGLPGSTPAIDRSNGFHEIINETGAEILATAPGNWQQSTAIKVVDSLLKIYPQTNLIFAHNDRMATGARRATEKHNRTDIKIIGIDAAPHIGIQAVKDGKIDATFLYPTEGNLVLKEAIKIATGIPVIKEVALPTTSAVDTSNADLLILQNENIEENTQKVLDLKSRLDDYVSLHHAQTALVYAIIAILILLFGFLFLVLRAFWSHRRHQAALLMKNRQLEDERDIQKELNHKLEEATQSKLVFFTNVSHDLRTPLTLIAEPVAQLNQADNLGPQQKNLIKLADKNVRILQRLINQILDFRKFDNSKLKLNLTEIDFNKVINDWLESFITVAKKRDIKLNLINPPYEVKLAIDPEKFERVFFNLISNALKYSPDNSTITISYEIADNNMVLKVTDQGIGISREDIVNIFDRFFQVEHMHSNGSGIGLSLAKAFVELHNGSISVESELKKGSTFTIKIPVTHIAEETTDVKKNISRQDIESEFEIIETEKTFTEDLPLLLIIDDNKDIREMVTQLLQDDYNILTASNGKDGLLKARKYVPDVIVCDVMMPGIDGLEVCVNLKNEIITSHIPVLMLTACSLDEQKVQGFDSGADGYISKPFSTQVLKSNLASLIKNRKRIKEALASYSPSKEYDKGESKKSNANIKSPVLTILPSNNLKDIDNEFFKRFCDLFDKKMSDPDLNVEAIASELGFERTQLYRKIKAITNYSPVELMRNLRLSKARTLLKTTDKSISEICYQVGFSTPAYFTKCYKEHFGTTPTEDRNL